MKKTIIIALTLFLVLASFTSCENNIHQHTWDKGTVTKEATCTEAGVMTYTCTGCKETQTAAIEALGHSWDEGVITKSTYLTKGTKTFTCQREGCGETETEEISTSLPVSGKVFAYYAGKNPETEEDLIGLFVMGDQQVTMYNGVVDESKSVTATNGISAPYFINIEDKTFTVTPPGGTPVIFGLEEYLDEDGNVVILKVSMDSYVYYLNPITGLETVEKNTEKEHYLIFNNENPISIKVLNDNVISEAISLDSISYAVEHEIETKPGYLTKGAYNCSVCGFKGEIQVKSLAGTKWLSTVPVNAPQNDFINGLYLQIDFLYGPFANISVKESVDSPAHDIESNRPYDVQFDDVAGTATINISGLYAPNYGGSAKEDLENGQITINIEAFEVGNLTFKQIIEE